MDYTDRPWTNTAPDKPTFFLLQQMYGTTGTSTTSTTSNTRPDDDGYITSGSSSTVTVVSSASGSSITQPQQQQQGEVGTNGEQEASSIPDTIQQRAKEAASSLRQKFANGENTLQGDEATAGFQIDLGDGYILQTNFLLAT